MVVNHIWCNGGFKKHMAPAICKHQGDILFKRSTFLLLNMAVLKRSDAKQNAWDSLIRCKRQFVEENIIKFNDSTHWMNYERNHRSLSSYKKQLIDLTLGESLMTEKVKQIVFYTSPAQYFSP